MATRRAGGTPATVALDGLGVPYTLHRYEHDPRAASFGQEAADALGFPAEQVFKTLLVTDGRTSYVGVVPVSGSLDLKALARAAGTAKVELMDAAAAQRVTGYVVGGISPLAQKRSLPTFVDRSANDWPTILVSAGKRGFDVEIAPADLLRATGGSFAEIGRA